MSPHVLKHLATACAYVNLKNACEKNLHVQTRMKAAVQTKFHWVLVVCDRENYEIENESSNQGLVIFWWLSESVSYTHLTLPTKA